MNITIDLKFGSTEMIPVPTGVFVHGVEAKGWVIVTRNQAGNITNLEVCEPAAHMRYA